MRQLATFLGVALAAALVMQPAHLDAQQPAQQQECTASLAPVELASGAEATLVTITVSQPIGEVIEVEATESGIRIAEVSALPMTPLAGPDDSPAPIRMGDSDTQWLIYLNTVDAQPGSHELTFRSAEGTCTAQITVGDAAQ